MDTPVKLGYGLVLLSGWDALRREVRERPRQGSGPMSEPTTIKVKEAGSSQWSGGRAPAGVVGREPAPDRAHGCRDRRPAPQRDFVPAKAYERGGRRGAGALRLGRLYLFLLPLPLPLPWFRALPRADSERRAGPKVESGVLRHSHGQVSDQMGAFGAPELRSPAGRHSNAAVKTPRENGPRKAGGGGRPCCGRRPSARAPTGRASRTPENAEAHAVLDAAVAAAYGWPADITDDDALRELLKLNGGGRKFELSKAQARELGISPVTLYRYLGPQGELRQQGQKVLAS